MKNIYQALQNKPYPILVLLGITASGKTQVSLDLAKKLDAEIISSDSVQVYKGLNIGSAKPSPKQLKAVPHHLIDILEPQELYNVGKFVRFSQQALNKIHGKKKIPILIAGNMLYVRCLLEGMASIPEITADAKKKVADFYQQGLEVCYQELISRDKLSKKKIAPQDTQRILRALEVFLSHKRSIFEFHQENHSPQKKYNPIYLGIAISKEEAHYRINKRVWEMVKNGFLEEVKMLVKNHSVKASALQSIGYKQGVLFLQGKLTKEAMINQIQQKTRQYAKRQKTWYQRVFDVQWMEKNKF